MSYTVISEVSSMLLSLLRDNLVPDLIQKRDAVQLCQPKEHGSAAVSLCLYDVKRSEEVLAGGMRNLDSDHQGYPSIYLNLYYMVSLWIEGDTKYRSLQEQQIMGRIVQVFHDVPLLTDASSGLDFPVKLEWYQMDENEKGKITNLPEIVHKAVLFYKVYPVEIESARTKLVRRVSNFGFDVEDEEE